MRKTKLTISALILSTALSGCSLFTTGGQPAESTSSITEQTEEAASTEKQNNEDKETTESKDDVGKETTEEITTEAVKKDVIAITDSLNHEDPDDIEIGAVYAYTTGNKAPEYVDNYKKYYGVDFIEQFMILYADKDDHAVAEYDYYVFETEKDAQEFGKAIDYEASNGKIFDNVVMVVLDETNLDALIKMDMQFGSLTDESAKKYAEFTKEVSSFINVQR